MKIEKNVFMSENVHLFTPTFALKFLRTKMLKNVSVIILLLISVCGFAQTYGSYCDTCVYQLSRDSLNRPQFQGGKVITPPIHKATMLMMNRKMYYELMAITLNLNTKADLNNVVTLTTAQTITGKKRFSDTLISDKGMKSGGVIETKGLNTEGASNKPSVTYNGVQKTKRRLITDDMTLDGTDFFFEIQCTTKDITILLPTIAISDAWFYDMKRTDDTPFVVRFQRPDGSFIRILTKRSATLRNNGTNWNFD
jgi:Lower baseplate protein N-terminal domain